PQTAGELRSRSDRLYAFESIAEVEDTLRRLDPITVELPRRPGQKESRWMQTLSGGQAMLSEPAEAGPHTEPLSARVQQLEEQVAALTGELRALKAKLGE
ncbi:MAG TPA: DUF480 domain-containing protein, partial [Thermoanaerobaculia bacterium]|nr:DUF480 domain-containing protein [Thermoanaerobaculia bacterium]